MPGHKYFINFYFLFNMNMSTLGFVIIFKINKNKYLKISPNIWEYKCYCMYSIQYQKSMCTQTQYWFNNHYSSIGVTRGHINTVITITGIFTVVWLWVLARNWLCVGIAGRRSDTCEWFRVLAFWLSPSPSQVNTMSTDRPHLAG